MTPLKIPLADWSKSRTPPALTIIAPGGKIRRRHVEHAADLDDRAAGIGIAAGQFHGAADQVENAATLNLIVEHRAAIAGNIAARRRPRP